MGFGDSELPSTISKGQEPGLSVRQLPRFSIFRTKEQSLRLVDDEDHVVVGFDPNGVTPDTWLDMTIARPHLPYPTTLCVVVRTTTTEALAATDTIKVRVHGRNGRGRDVVIETQVMACVATTAASNDSNIFFLPQVFSYVSKVEIQVSATLALPQRAIDVGVSNEWTYTDTTGRKHRFPRNHGIGTPWEPMFNANFPYAQQDAMCIQLERTSGTAFVATLVPGVQAGSGINCRLGDLDETVGQIWRDDLQKLRIAASTAAGDSGTTIVNHTTSAQAIAKADVMYLRMVGRSTEGALARPSNTSTYAPAP